VSADLSQGVADLAADASAQLKTTRTAVTTHIGDTNNPHSTSKAQIGLSRVNNVSITVGTTAPSNPQVGDLWVDTN
jgi:hypothetical protein